MRENKRNPSYRNKPNVVFLNQHAGLLFRELAEDITREFGGGVLFTGHTDEIDRPIHPSLRIIRSPSQRTDHGVVRIISWLTYILFVLPHLFSRRKSHLLFIASNPPLLPWIGFLSRQLWGQRYVILIYDVYPDMLVRFAGMADDGVVIRLWRWLNKISFENADAVFTIGNYMAQVIDGTYDPAKTRAGRTIVIPNWADPAAIKPLEKKDNPFAVAHDQLSCLTVLYSGTIGLKHNIKAMIDAAIRLKHVKDIHFMFIGRGAGFDWIKKVIKAERLTNTTLMSFLPESDIPFSLAGADVAVVALDRGGEGIYVPGKTYYAMAAGSALLALSSENNEVSDIVRKYNCGIIVPPDDVDAFVKAVYRFHNNPNFLSNCRHNARSAIETHFNRRVCSESYIEVLKSLGLKSVLEGDGA